MSTRWARWLIGSLAWMGSLYAALSLRHLDLPHGLTVCGPWGCGGSTEDLLAVHTAWGVMLAPPTVFLVSRKGKLGRWNCRFGAIALFLAAAGLMAIALHTLFLWLPAAPEDMHGYHWQRFGFVVVNMVDLPLLQMAVAGSVVLLAEAGARLKHASSRHDGRQPIGDHGGVVSRRED